MDERDFFRIGVVPAYFQLAGALTNKLAWTDQTLNEIIATDLGLDRNARQQYADEKLVDKSTRSKLVTVAAIADRILGGTDETTLALRTPASDLLALRNKVAHGYVVEFDLDPSAVTLSAGVYRTGYLPVRVVLRDLYLATDQANDLLCHATCLWTHLPGSGQEPQRFADLD